MVQRIACMGGWCTKRDTCGRYHEQVVRHLQPSERLCTPNLDDQWISIDGLRPSRDVSFEVDQRMRRVFGITVGA